MKVFDVQDKRYLIHGIKIISFEIYFSILLCDTDTDEHWHKNITRGANLTATVYVTDQLNHFR